ncbi:aromatic ring-hydroxylating oxygenase subunit alpha [Novosphingobium pentaromativorans]|uniref:cholesterol 7-desaturase n=1 Tax=Novosphingobium pentaromativorans US6-1 TaxID=1088721 RepID=G6EAU5_9SPHN|nr:Rieske 2Fe-2S domain-containing protein [Novosphingobium pentaromativorans]EHJ61732.1 hypothetical protein NSU_1493 [Novosphingobium pentaromativorans US6-1]
MSNTEIAEKPTEKTATRQALNKLNVEDIEAWRLIVPTDNPSADERNLQKQFPMGWFTVCYSSELAIGEVKPVRYFGTDLAVWRGEDGTARVIDAYCAHYGANMAVGGKVHGNLLECPFHAWRWDETGACKDIPYSRVIPPKAKRADCVPAWSTREVNGFVMVWHHPDRIAPLWEPASFTQIGHEDWTDLQTFEWKTANSMENMSDNAVDVSHFKYVHGTLNVPDYEFEFDGIMRRITAQIQVQTSKGELKGQIESITYGPGQGWVRYSGISDTLMVTGSAPIERDLMHSRFAFTQPKTEIDGPRAGLARALIKEVARQFDQDKVIFDRHHRFDPPLVCQGDGPFARNSDWFSQFYASSGKAPDMSATPDVAQFASVTG